MKIQSSTLYKFVEDFNLEGKDGIVCFEARIIYTTSKKQIQLPTEVHIIHLSSAGVDVIYLLDMDVVEHGIPDMIGNLNTIFYRNNEYLYIKDSSPKDGNYIISIHPTAAECEPDALKELHAKSYN